MSKIHEHALFSIGSVPISDDQPCGVNVRYESDFEQLEAELAKQESLKAETVDWDVVAQLSSRIIQSSSKDLLVGSYLCYALLVKDGYHGLSVGINILNDMVSLHWDCLFPPAKRMRARQTAFTWLAEKAGIYVSATTPNNQESESVVEAATMLKQLDGALVEKMGDQAPMLTELSRPLKNYRQSAEAELANSQPVAVVPEPAAQQPAPQASIPETTEPQVAVLEQASAVVKPAPAVTKSKAPIAPPPETGSLESDADSKKILRQLQTTARDVASFWITQKVSDARSYRVARMAAFMVVESVPPDNNGVTQINSPAPERLKFFEAEAAKGDLVSLIPELEKTLARSPFWFDGQFLVVKSLRSLGAEYEAAAQTVIRELGNFISRLPDVVGLSFLNETPFADDQTRMWLDAEVLNQNSDATGGGASESPAGELWNSTLVEAKQLAASGGADKALAMMSEGMSNASQLREQVYWRCAIAELLIHTGKSDTAASILEQASQQLKVMQLPEWEPLLLAKIYTLLFQSYKKQQKTNKEDKSLVEKADLAYEQLCWFDPITALSLTGG
ncbi:MAG: type VI secretion system protein VasJ [Candidatus Azotimanducaceae bacterium]|jgi:type VI secretion system protein VasJ